MLKVSIIIVGNMLECDADRHKFGIYIFSKVKDWKTTVEELLYGYISAFYLGKIIKMNISNKYSRTYSAENAKRNEKTDKQ